MTFSYILSLGYIRYLKKTPLMDKKRVSALHEINYKSRPRVSYNKRDFLDYLIMICVCMALLIAAFEEQILLLWTGIALCIFMVVSFVWRHGVSLKIPLILNKPEQFFFSLFYKIKNVPLVTFIAFVALMMENLFVSVTPELPHYSELLRQIFVFIFFFHLALISVYRTAILVAHLNKKELVSEILEQSPIKNFIRGKSISLEIIHAYFTGVLTHIMLLIPWYLVINYIDFSLVLLPLSCFISYKVHILFYKTKNYWYYRDHWLGHNMEFDFVYLHGGHHDAIPSGLIGVAGNGFIEGVTRHTLGHPTSYLNPLVSFVLHCKSIKRDIDSHQYIPGIFPKVTTSRTSFHSIHHYGNLEPYGLGLRMGESTKNEKIGLFSILRVLPSEYTNAIALDEEATGFNIQHNKYRWYIKLVDKYDK